MQRVTALVADHMQELDNFMNQQVEDFEPEIQELVHYCLRHSGKRIRPLLVFASGYRAGAQNPAPDQVKAAAIVELVHLATLVHDDILDGAVMRHSSPTLRKKYGPKTAVLLGDALFAHALKLSTEYPHTWVCQRVAIASRKVCAGEICQTFEQGNPDLNLKTYYQIIEAKTGELFRLSCWLGARLAGKSSQFANDCATYGNSLGAAYQIYDDLSDFLGDENRIGKTLGTDFKNGRYTIPMILLRDKIQSADQGKTSIPIHEMPLDELHKQLLQSGIYAAVANEFQSVMTVAHEALDRHKPDPSCAIFDCMAEIIQDQFELLLGKVNPVAVSYQ